jgi:putative ABC transport system permease protein
MKILLNLVRKDFKWNRVITTALAVFLVLSALLMAGGLRTAATMVSSLNGLSEKAIPPEYLQMHKGPYDEEAFAKYVGTKDYIEDSLVVQMLNIRNSGIIYEGETLERYLMDNGFVVQNEGFDFLLDLDNEIATVKNGEIGVPVYYAEELGIEVGDSLTLREGDYSKSLKVSTLIRDAAMNSALASSKRFLVTEEDRDELSLHMGEWEYSFEFLLAEDTSTALVEKEYKDAGMPSNGVALSGSLLTLLNAFSYGLVAFIIITISILLVLMAFLCLSYIIKATMAEENQTIGEMKAIGFPGKEIGKLYQMKYVMLVTIAGVIGYLGAIPLGNFFSTAVVRYCGPGTGLWMAWVIPLVGILLLSLIVVLGCRRIIRRNLRSTVVQLMRGEENMKREGHYTLPVRGLRNRNLTIAFGELKCKWKEYSLIFIVFVFASFLIQLPTNMKNTVENPSFMTYMGVGESDIRIDLQYSEKLEEQKDAVLGYLEDNPEIEKYAIYRNGYVQLQNKDGDWEYVRVENGDGSVFPLQYLEGCAPVEKKDMALSYLNASELGKTVGDSMTVVYQGEEILVNISGVYQDITYGGRSAKAAIDFEESDVDVYIIYLDLREGVAIGEKTDELRTILTGSKITPVSEFVSQTLGGITDNMSLIEVAAVTISLLLVMLITMMFIQLLTAREHRAIAIKKAIGFSTRDIRIQFGVRILVIQFLAIVTGTILANVLGEAIFGLMLSSMGASKITMLVHPLSAYLLFPAAQLLVVLVTVVIGTRAVRNYHIRDQIIE